MMGEVGVTAALAGAAESVAGMWDRQHGPPTAQPFIGGGAWHSWGASDVALWWQLLWQEGRLQEQVGLSWWPWCSACFGSVGAALQMQGLAAQSGVGGAPTQSAGRWAATRARLPPMFHSLQPGVWLMVMGLLFTDVQVGFHWLDHLLKVLDFFTGFFQS